MTCASRSIGGSTHGSIGRHLSPNRSSDSASISEIATEIQNLNISEALNGLSLGHGHMVGSSYSSQKPMSTSGIGPSSQSSHSGSNPKPLTVTKSAEVPNLNFGVGQTEEKSDIISTISSSRSTQSGGNYNSVLPSSSPSNLTQTSLGWVKIFF